MKTTMFPISLLLLIMLCFPITAQSSKDVILDLSQEKSMSFFHVYANSEGVQIPVWNEYASTASSRWLVVVNGDRFYLQAEKWEPIVTINDDTYLLAYKDADYGIEQILKFSEDRTKGYLTLSVSNLSEAEINLRTVLLLDTSLSDFMGHPSFILPGNESVTMASEFKGRMLPEWVSTVYAHGDIGLTLSYDTNSVPTRMVMANYYELVARPLGFILHENRSFITIHRQEEIDNALLLEYEQAKLGVNESAEFTLKFSLGLGSTFASFPSNQKLKETIQATEKSTEFLISRLQSISAILDSIDRLESNPVLINENSVAAIEIKIDEEESLHREYGNP